jgi:hypothetical protein
MNTIATKPEAPDELDKLFSDFFKAQLRQPWPNAPVASAAAPASEPKPATLAKGRDGTARARLTLAASVALALGACWTLSNGLQPTERPNGTSPSPAPGMLQDGGAKDTGVLPTIEKHKATGDNGGMKIDLEHGN